MPNNDQQTSLNNFRIRAGGTPGRCIVDGIEVTINEDIVYIDQNGVPALTTPIGDRVDAVYLDVWLRSIDGFEDADLKNNLDIGFETSVRRKPTWLVRVAEGMPVPAPAIGHSHFLLARISRPRGQGDITSEMITDLREINRIDRLEQEVYVPKFNASPNQFSPASAYPGEEIRLYGTHFDEGEPRVFFNYNYGGGPRDDQKEMTVTYVSRQEIRATCPSLPGPIVGSLTVLTANGSVRSTDKFTIPMHA